MNQITHTLKFMFIQLVKIKLLLVLVLILNTVASKNVYAIEGSFINQNGETVISVKSDIRLSDVFNNIPSHLDRILGPAPIPGTQIVLTETDFNKIIKRYSLPSKTSYADKSLIITHLMNNLSYEKISNHVKQALLPSLKEYQNVEIVINTNKLITIPSGYTLSSSVKIMSLDKRKKSFKVILSGVSNDGKVYQLDEVKGYFIPLVKVSVIKSSVSAGQIISNTSLSERWVPATKVKSNNVINKNDLIGMRARRQLLTGDIVKTGDIKVAILVKRGDKVTVEYRTQNMALTAKMTAKEQGAKGDVIKLQASDKVIEGRVVGIGYVVVSNIISNIQR